MAYVRGMGATPCASQESWRRVRGARPPGAGAGGGRARGGRGDVTESFADCGRWCVFVCVGGLGWVAGCVCVCGCGCWFVGVGVDVIIQNTENTLIRGNASAPPLINVFSVDVIIQNTRVCVCACMCVCVCVCVCVSVCVCMCVSYVFLYIYIYASSY